MRLNHSVLQNAAFNTALRDQTAWASGNNSTLEFAPVSAIFDVLREENTYTHIHTNLFQLSAEEELSSFLFFPMCHQTASRSFLREAGKFPGWPSSLRKSAGGSIKELCEQG